MRPNLNPRRIASAAIVLVALAALGYWYFGVRPSQAASGALGASGTIEITQVQIAAELGGKVTEVRVAEGDQVKAGDTLVQLDATLLKSQRAQAAAALDVAKANAEAAQMAAQQAEADQTAAQIRFDLAKSTETASREANISAARLALLQAQNALTDLEQNAATVTANAQLALVKAQDNLTTMSNRRTWMNGDRASQGTIDAAEATYYLMLDNLKKAQQAYNQIASKYKKTDPRVALALTRVADAEKQKDAALAALNWYTGKPDEQDISEADANLALAQAQLDAAKTRLDEVKDGPSVNDVTLAKEKIANAQALVDLANAQSASQQVDLAQAALNSAQARSGAASSQAAAAKAQVEVTQAALDALDVQIGKLTILAPADGVVLTRIVQPGEFNAPGASLLVLGLVEDKTITVYISEAQYGRLSVGQSAQVSVDSFPGQSFQAWVVHIADQAEFTPRNVQTAQGRRDTVFAIKLKVDDPDGKLKAGMPADVVFK